MLRAKAGQAGSTGWSLKTEMGSTSFETSKLVSKLLDPPPANAPHRLPLSEALSELDICSRLPYSPGGVSFRRDELETQVRGRSECALKISKNRESQCESIGMERGTRNGAGRLAYQDHLALPGVS